MRSRKTTVKTMVLTTTISFIKMFYGLQAGDRKGKTVKNVSIVQIEVLAREALAIWAEMFYNPRLLCTSFVLVLRHSVENHSNACKASK